ncbi:MAG: glycoside hydrolase N-terminal domain-containing protein [Oscillospiraceae bacterium]
MDILRFDGISEKWENGLAIGNGRLAAMVWNTENSHVLSLNHEWIWTGNFKNRECDDSAHFLPLVRDFLKKGEHFKATALAAVAFGGNGGISPLTRRMDSFQPACDIVFTHDTSLNQKRILDMEKGIAQMEYEQNNHNVLLTAFCHLEKNMFVFNWKSAAPFSGSLSILREESPTATPTLHIRKNEISFSVSDPNGVSFTLNANISTNGCLSVQGNSLRVENATYCTILANIGTSIQGIETELANVALAGEFDALCESHSLAFSKIMNQWKIDLYDENTSELCKLTIDQRQQRLKNGQTDVQLFAIYARFAMYLMVSGSETAQLPLNLQGKWNRSVTPKWNSDYHLNINLQMNYWFTDALSMDKYTKQMTDYILTLLPNARKAAKRLYGCKGILYPLNSDIWANVTSEAYNYAVWIASAGWLATHFYNNWLHTGDTTYLREYAYPFIKEAAQFYEDYIELDENGVAQLMPSQSPENKFQGCGYFPVSMCISSAMDVQIAYDTFTMACECAHTLCQDADEALLWQQLRDKLPQFKIGKDGRLLEWDSDDKIEIEKGHRHVSHLYGVYPSELFTPERRKEQFIAARKSLDYRLAHSGGHTGWSSAWSACLFARFLDCNKALASLTHLIANQSSQTLLDLHPDYYPKKADKEEKNLDQPLLFTQPDSNPPMIFQIDGNFGACAALLEMLIQKRNDIIYLLPAVSENLGSGTLCGVRVRGGHKISFSFENGKVTALECEMGFENKLQIKYNSINKSIVGNKGDIIKLI